jgi:hypothetical protein
MPMLYNVSTWKKYQKKRGVKVIRNLCRRANLRSKYLHPSFFDEPIYKDESEWMIKTALTPLIVIINGNYLLIFDWYIYFNKKSIDN